MPIKGLTDRPPRLPRIGKIHLGVKVSVKKDGTPCAPYPRATDYFVFEPDHPGYAELVETYGEKPKELRILLPIEDETKFAQQFYRLYSLTRGLVCKGDGEEALRMIDTATGGVAGRDTKDVAMKPITCQGRDCPEYGPRACGEVMNLQFLLPEVSGFGVWQIDTGSINSIINVNSALDLIRGVYGRVAMVPLILALEPKEVVNPDDGKKKTVRVLNIRSTDKMIEAYHKAQLPPLQLVASMVSGSEFIEGEELPPAGDEHPHGDLPVASEVGPETDTDLWPEDEPPKPDKATVGRAADGGPPALDSAVVPDRVKPQIGPKTTILPDGLSHFPANAKVGDIAIVKTTGDRWEYGEGNWIPKGKETPVTDTPPIQVEQTTGTPATTKVSTTEGAPPTIPSTTTDDPWPGMTFADLITWVKAHKYNESWLFKNSSMSVTEAKADPFKCATDIKAVSGW